MRALVALIALAALAVVGGAAYGGGNRPDPTGSFSISEGPHLAGEAVSFTFGDFQMVKQSYEVTLGVWCDPPIPWGSDLHNPWIHEFNSFGTVYEGYTVSLVVPTAGTCTARLIAADWFKGYALQAWTLDEHSFEVTDGSG